MTDENKPRELWRHKKRGGTYEVLHRGRMQIDHDLDSLGYRDYEDIVVYRAEDGTVWVRPECEFMDGRFERV